MVKNLLKKINSITITHVNWVIPILEYHNPTVKLPRIRQGSYYCLMELFKSQTASYYSYL